MIISSFRGTAKLHTSTTEKTFQVIKNAKLIWTNLKGHIYHAESTGRRCLCDRNSLWSFQLWLSKLVSMFILLAEHICEIFGKWINS